MNPEASITVTVGAALSIIAVIWRMASRMGVLELKVNTLWEFQMRRGISEGVAKGGLSMNSPVRLTDRGREWFPPELRQSLREWYKAKGMKLGERDLGEAIEREFGERINHEVCIPHELWGASCLVTAILIARETDGDSQ